MRKNNDKWKFRFDSYCKALQQLENAVNQNKYTDLEKQGLIKCFEFSFELAWKTQKDYLTDVLGYDEINGPKPVIKQAFQSKIITDGNLWIEMLEDRNRTTHCYDEETIDEIFDKIKHQYFVAMLGLKNTLLVDYNK